MNANELINKLKLVRCIAGDGQILNEAATMLRILDGQLAFRIDAVTKYQAKVKEQQAEIEALKKQLTNLQELTITNDEIKEVIKSLEDFIYFDEKLGFFELKDFALAILKRACEK
jgi:hypothetical protein